MPITIKKLAAELGVSPATVSLALNGSPLVADETRARVAELAARWEYVPNNFGKGLQSRKSHLLGYLLSGITGSFFNEILQGVGFEAARNNYGLLTGWLEEHNTAFSNQIQIMLEKNIDGLILSISAEAFRPYMDKFRRRQIPFIFCSAYCGEQYSSVITDNFQGGYLATKYLLDCGHRRILCCSIDPQRLAGNLAAIRDYRQGEGIVYAQPEEAVARLKSCRATAIATYSDLQAIDIMVMLAESKLRVPEDISIIGFDNLWIAGRPEFQLTTIGQQRMELGRQAFHGMMEMINGRNFTRMLLAPELIVRNTVKSIVPLT